MVNTMVNDKVNTMVNIEELWVYPVKSCRGQQVNAWPLGPNGLLFDREWALVDVNGRVLTQKQCSGLTSVVAAVDVEQHTLTLSWAGHTGVSVRGGKGDEGREDAWSTQVVVVIEEEEDKVGGGGAQQRCGCGDTQHVGVGYGGDGERREHGGGDQYTVASQWLTVC